MPKNEENGVGELPTISADILARAFCDALREVRTDALVSGVPSPGSKTMIDGRFDLVTVARLVLLDLGKRGEGLEI